MKFLFCLPDILSWTLSTCHTVYHVGGFACDVLFDGVCARCLCDVDLVGEHTQFARIAPLVPTSVETGWCAMLVAFVVGQ